MDYPVLIIPALGGGFLIALIAVIHVYVAHFAVGGGLYLVLTEHYARKNNSPAMLDFVRRHTRFFLLLTMVFGSLTGVGIWFTIAITSPGATLTLIRAFALGWATEWVFFLGEIIALLVYYYTFKTMDARRHLIIGWIYFVFGWLSLFLINGIIGAMLTPGQWIETGNFWHGFFNPSFWPQLVFRSLLAFAIAGLFAFLTAAREKDQDLALKLSRFSAAWTVIPLILLAPAAWWYVTALPEAQRTMVMGLNPEINAYIKGFVLFGPLLLAGGLLMAVRLNRALRHILAGILLLVGLLHMGSFEFIREAARRPFVIYDHTYSNGIPVATAETINQKGFLANLRWTRFTTITSENKQAVGREIFNNQCLSCHSLDGPMNDIIPLTRLLSYEGIDAQLVGQGSVHAYMPPFFGTTAERDALVAFLATGLHGKTPEAIKEIPITELPLTIPPFQPDKDEYVLLAWSTLGMKCVSDADAFFSFLPPGSNMGAVLIKRGPQPEIIRDGVDILYEAPKDMKNPAKQVAFWNHSESLLGKKLAPNTCLSGKGVDGAMAYDETSTVFGVVGIPVVPYADDGSINPYPLFTITAKDKASGRVLAKTQAVLPVGTEMACFRCHGGTWRKNDVTGISDVTAQNILAVHDRRHKTDLLPKALAGKPQLCQSCHPDPLLKADGRPGLINLPAAIHGFHANYLKGQGPEVCSKCHPDSPIGVTRCLRDSHSQNGLDCTSCHGFLEDHALSLLKKEQELGKKMALPLMRHLKPRSVPSLKDVVARTPWDQEPDCLTCHKDYQKPDPSELNAFNVWTTGGPGLYRNRMDDAGVLPCIACHNSPHALYPTRNPYGKDRDNIQPLQYQKKAGPIGAGNQCGVCHGPKAGLDPSMSPHHPMGLK